MGLRRLLPAVLAAVAIVALADGASASNDIAFNQQWNLPKISAPSAWSTSTGAGVTVGIVDSGADQGHPDFGGRVTTYDCTVSGNGCGAAGSGADQNGHGTHVSGIVAATKDNGEGIAGVAPAANVVVAKVFVCDDSACENPGASFEDVVKGVNLVLSKGAKVVNLSLGDPGVLGTGFFCNNSDFVPLLNQIWNAGAVPVFAAGNCGPPLTGGDSSGAFSSTRALIVGATDRNDAVADYSSPVGGAMWGVLAPGGGNSSCQSDAAGCILSTWPRSKISAGQSPYAWLRGTSMAAPHVTGAMAAILARQPDRTAAVNALLSHTDPIPSCSCKGRINLAAALGAAPAPPPTTKASAPSGPAGTTRTTAAPRKRTATTARPSGSAPSTTVSATGETTTTAEPVAEEPAIADKHLEVATGAGSSGSRPSDEEPSGPLKVLGVLGVLGVGGTTAPLVWRRFLRSP